MNQRIKELAEQAEKLADEETNAFTDDTGQWQVIWNEVYDKKFAELIVRECAAVASKFVHDNKYKEGGISEYWLQDGIKEHFGVE